MAGRRCLMLEVALFLFMMAYDMKKNALLDLIYEKTCITSFSESVCAELKDPKNSDAFSQVQAKSSNWIFLTQVFQSFPGLLTCLYMGSVSDLTNRKVPLIISSLGEVFSTLLLIILANWKLSSLWLAPISCGISGLGGNFIVTIYGIVSYVSDLSSEESRTMRMSMLEGMSGAGAIIGLFTSAVVIGFFSQMYIYVLVIFIYTVQFLYIIYGVESRKPERTGVKYTVGCSDVCGLQPFRDVYVTLMRKRKGFDRLYIVCDVYIFATAVITSFGIFDILYLYVKDKPLEWNYTEYSIFVSMIYIGRTIGSLVLLPLFKKLLTNVSDVAIIAVGIFFRLLGLILWGFMVNASMAFGVVALDSSFSFIMAGCKGLLSKLVFPDEQGKIFSVLASVDNIAILIAALIYNTIYPLTRLMFNGLLFECSALILVPSFILACMICFSQNRRRCPDSNEESSPLVHSSQRNGYETHLSNLHHIHEEKS